MIDNKIKFEEAQYERPQQTTQRNLFIDFLINKGLAKSEQQATYILFGIIGISILITIWLLLSSSPQPNTEIKILPQETVGSRQGV